jgi:glucose-6-phosphate isomerase
VQAFSQQVHQGTVSGSTGSPLRHVVVVGSSSLPPFSGVATALRMGDNQAQTTFQGRSLHILKNVDPAHVADVTNQIVADETIVVVVSKTFAEPDVLLNAKAIRRWLAASLQKTEDEVTHHHFCAVSCNPAKCAQFGIPKDRAYRLSEWVVPRFSVCSAAGLLPLALAFGWNPCARLLQGCHDMDEHFFMAPLRDNIPVIMGLLGFWNSTFLGYPTRAVVPYSEALREFPEFVQQVDMGSNGKRVAIDGTALLHKSAEIDFGGAGTACQNVFFQLLHQGRVVPVDFIGFMEGPCDVDLPGEAVSNHDELMSHFFAQPDALAYGKTLVDRT